MSRSSGDGPEAGDVAETARRMTRALDYLIKVSTAAGMSRVAMRLVTAQAELLVATGRKLSEPERTGSGQSDPRSAGSPKLH